MFSDILPNCVYNLLNYKQKGSVLGGGIQFIDKWRPLVQQFIVMGMAQYLFVGHMLSRTFLNYNNSV